MLLFVIFEENVMSDHLNDLLQLDLTARLNYSIKEMVKNNCIWILTDEHGCMMLNTEDEDCVPVWPSAELANLWINNDWQHCRAEAIDLTTWFSRWTSGLMEDDLALLVFPLETGEGMVIFPDEFDDLLTQQKQKIPRK